MEKYIHLEMSPVFVGRAIFDKDMKSVWVRFLDLQIQKGESDISLCSKLRGALVFDKPPERIKKLKTRPSQHLYRITQIKALVKPGSLLNVKTREIQAIYEFCRFEYHLLMEGILKSSASLQDFEQRYPTIGTIEQALEEPNPSWVPQKQPTAKAMRESTRVFRDPNVYPGHLGG